MTVGPGLVRVLFSFLFLTVVVAGCAGSTAPGNGGVTLTSPIRMQSADLAVTLVRIAGQGDKETLVKDPGWREYGIEIENLSTKPLTNSIMGFARVHCPACRHE